MKKLLSITAVIVIAMTAPSYADTRVSADSTDMSGGKYKLKGNVVIERDGTTLRADSATFDEPSGTVSAKGNITIKGDKAEASASRAEFNINSSVGSLYDANLVVGDEGYRVSSGEIRLAGPGHYVLNSASVTTCDDLPPTWCMVGKDLDVIAGERITLWHATLKIKGLPVFYSPYLYAPIVNARRTGLLVPSIGYRSSMGYFYSQPFFWAISPVMDSTLTLDYHTERAFGQRLEFRFLTGPRTGGEMELRHLRDYTLDSSFGEAHARYDKRGDWVSAGLDLNAVNRQDYYRRYADMVETQASRYLDSRLEIWHEFGDHSRLFADSLHKYDLKNGVDNNTVLQRVGEVGLNMAPKALGLGFIAFGGMEAAAFERTVGYTGQRAVARAGLMHSLPGSLNITQSLGYEGASYTIMNGDSSDESMSTAYLDYNARISFRAEAYVGGSQVLHSIEHEFGYDYRKLNGDSPPVLDYSELRAERSVAHFALTHRLRGAGGDFMKARLRQPLDLKRNSDDRLMPLGGDLSLGGKYLSAQVSADYDYDTHKAGHIYAGLGLDTRSFSINLGDNYDRLEGVETYTLNTRLRLTGRWTLEGGARYDNMEEQGYEERWGSLEYKSQCWSLKTVYVRRPDDYNVMVSFGLLGLGASE